jgi:hypothetical protein
MNNAMAYTCGEVYVTDTTGPSTLFYQPTVYNKGQGVVTMLRYLAPTDSLFFRAMRIYQQAYSYGNAGIDQMAAIVDTVYGFSVDSFLHQWLYGKGFPRYTITWDQVGSSVFIKLVQARTCPANTVHFNTPVELQLHGTAGDTIVKAYNTTDTELFVFNWAQTMDTLIFNPDLLTMARLIGVTRQDTMLRYEVRTGSVRPGKVNIFPNPSKDFWQVENLPAETEMVLADGYGRAVWHGRSTGASIVIPGKGLPAGNYFLKLSGNEQTDSIQLLHW